MIQKFFIDLKLKSANKATEIQQSIYDLVNTDLANYIEKEFKRISPNNDETFFIPKIEIDLKNINEKDFLNEFKFRFISEFRKKLSIALAECEKNKNFAKISKSGSPDELDVFSDLSKIADADFFALKFFLVKGYFPWWFETEKNNVSGLIKNYLRTKTDIFTDFVFSGKTSEKSAKILRIFNNLSEKEFKIFFFKTFLEKYSENKKSDRIFIETAEEILGYQTLKKILLKTFVKFSPKSHSPKKQTQISVIQLLIDEFESIEKEKQFILLSETKTRLSENRYSKIVRFLDKTIYEKNLSAPANIRYKYLEKSETFPVNRTEKLAGIYKEIISKNFDDSQTPVSKKSIEKNKIVRRGGRLIQMPQEGYNETGQTYKQLDLNLFDYDFIRDLAFIFIFTGKFPAWAKELINTLKATKRIKSEFKILEYILIYTEKYYPENFKKDFFVVFTQNQTVISISETFPENIILNIIKLLIKLQKSAFESLMSEIKIVLELRNDISATQKNEFLIKYLLQNLSDISERLQKNEISEILDEFKTSFTQKPDFEIFNIKEIEELISELLQTGIISQKFKRIKTEELENYFLEIENDFYLRIFKSPKNRFVFVSLFFEKIILIVLKKLYAGEFELLNKIHSELNLILSELKISAGIKKEVQKILYITGIELNISNTGDLQMRLQKYFSILKDFFKSQNIEFENFFTSSINSVFRNRIEIFKDFKISGMQIFINTFFPEKFFSENLSLIFHHFVFYIRYGYFHWSFPFKNMGELAELIIRNENEIIVKYKKELENLFDNEIKTERLFILLQKKSAKKFISKVLDIQQFDINSILKPKTNIENSEIEKNINTELENRSVSTEFTGSEEEIPENKSKIPENEFDDSEKKSVLHDEFPEESLNTGNDSVESEEEKILNFFFKDVPKTDLPKKSEVEIINQEISEKEYPDLNEETTLFKKHFELETKQIDKYNKEAVLEFFKLKQKEDVYEEIMKEKVDWVKQPPEQEKIYVKNAGLILLCSFLTFLFKRTGLLEKKEKKHEFKDEYSRVRAIHLTQYIVTGKTEHKEHELVLNKIICGVELNKPINMNIELTELEKTEAELMLKSVIGHWKILGNTSIDGLREMFLNRKAVLAFKNNAYNMKVEQKAIDVLMKKMPWSFQTIKLSWNDYIIYVDWTA